VKLGGMEELDGFVGGGLLASAHTTPVPATLDPVTVGMVQTIFEQYGPCMCLRLLRGRQWKINSCWLRRNQQLRNIRTAVGGSYIVSRQYLAPDRLESAIGILPLTLQVVEDIRECAQSENTIWLRAVYVG
jgi:hypothetical protein